MRKAISKIRPKEENRLVSIFFVAFLLIYYISSPAGNTIYDYFTRLADAFLQGKIYLSENPEWLNELIPAGDNRYYVAYPPMPAIVALPFRLLFGTAFPQQWLAHLLGAGTVALSVRLGQIILPKKGNVHIWIGLLTGASTVMWYLSSAGYSWYLGQVSAAFFLTSAVVSALEKRSLLAGIFLGAAYLSRIHTALALPLFLYLLWDNKERVKSFVLFGVGGLPFVLFNFWYNFARFGVIWDKGYTLIPGVLEEPWYQLGLVHPSYIVRHLDVIFTALPVVQESWPYIFPSWMGLAVWITTPALFLILLSPIKNRLVQATSISAILVSLPIIMHGTFGFAQFGYRFLIDLLPLLVLLLLFSIQRTGMKKLHWLLLYVGIIVNLWGVIWINKMGWVVV